MAFTVSNVQWIRALADVGFVTARAVPKVVHTIEELVDMGKWLLALVVILQCKQAAELRTLHSWQLHADFLACTIVGFLNPIIVSCISSLLHPICKAFVTSKANTSLDT